jgi:hypothetical protein
MRHEEDVRDERDPVGEPAGIEAIEGTRQRSRVQVEQGPEEERKRRAEAEQVRRTAPWTMPSRISVRTRSPIDHPG